MCIICSGTQLHCTAPYHRFPAQCMWPPCVARSWRTTVPLAISTLCTHYDILARSVFISFTSIANNNEYNNKGVLAAAILVLSRDSWRGKEEKKRGGEGGRRVCGEGTKKNDS